MRRKAVQLARDTVARHTTGNEAPLTEKNKD